MFDLIWWVIAALLIVGCIVQTALGFGFALLAAPVAVLLRPEWMPVLLTLVGLVLERTQPVATASQGAVARHGVAADRASAGHRGGRVDLAVASVGAVQAMIAGMVLLAVVMSRFGRKYEATPLRLGLAGFASGVAGTTTAIGGPPMVIVMQHGAPDTVRANLAWFFVCSSVFSLVSYTFIGRLDASQAMVYLSFVPVAVVGYWLGRPVGRRVGERFRPLVLGVCVVSAVIALAGALLRL